MKKTLFITIIVIFCIKLSANAYVKDRLYFSADTLLVNQLPLDSTLKAFLQSKSANLKACSHMKCDEGYRDWELRNDSLFLKRILNCCGDDLLDENSMNIFQSRVEKNEIFADWFNGKIYNQYGALIKRVYEEVITEYGRDFEIESGILIDIVKYDNRKSKVSKFADDNKLIGAFLKNQIDWKIIETNECILDKTVLINFEVDKQTGKPVVVKVHRSIGEICDAELIKAVEALPEWDLYYKKGKPQQMTWNLPINLSKLLKLEVN